MVPLQHDEHAASRAIACVSIVGMSRSRYSLDVSHPGLGTFQRFSGPDPLVVERRAQAKMEEWNRRWERQQDTARRAGDREHARSQREFAKAEREAKVREAETLTEEAEAEQQALEGILAATLDVNDQVDFETLKSREPFGERAPRAPKPQPQTRAPVLAFQEPEPPAVNFFQQIIEVFSSASMNARLARNATVASRLRDQATAEHQQHLAQWEQECAAIADANAAANRAHAAALQEHAARKADFEARQRRANDAIDSLAQEYRAGTSDAIQQYCDHVLSSSRYPDCFPQDFRLLYNPTSKMVLVEYVLPAPDELPSIKAVKYVASKDEFTEQLIPEKTLQKTYESVVYQVAIRTLHEIFEADVVSAVDSVAFNGVVNIVDKATGKPAKPCILSLHCSKAEFLELNLAAVDPKACIRKLKGVGSTQLASLAPVAPIVNLPRDDVRYVEGREVVETLHEGLNLAAMDWEDFEHLIRQLFEMEFGAAGGEVRVTRASRDGGVDAVILDPDPIRGGKYVVQAKRYINLVTVSAVRDLYGTMINEGAVKGILVTTATFGPDSYQFAKDKPITLIDGANLLYLLGRHGRSAHIDLEAARANLRT